MGPLHFQLTGIYTADNDVLLNHLIRSALEVQQY